MEDTGHLAPEAKAALDLPDEERLKHVWISGQWIGYERAHQVLQRLEDLYEQPPSHRMPNILLYGDSNNGKTVIARRFKSQHPARDDPDGETITVPVLMVEAPSKPDERRLFMSILDEICAPYRPNDNPAKLERQVLHYLRYVNVKVLVIDEIHNLIAGSLTKQREFLNLVKELGNQLQIPVVGVGTPEAIRAVGTDPQLANRFEPVELPRWKLDPSFARLLKTLESALPLGYPSGLSSRKMAGKVHSMTEGLIGEVSTLLRRAAAQAIRDGTERVTEASLSSLEWTAPSKRKR